MSLLVPIVVTSTYPSPGGGIAWGQVTFTLLETIVDPTDRATVPGGALPPVFLDENGSIAQQLYANDVEGLTPETTQYQVTERISGGTARSYFVTVPAVPPGSRTVSDGVLVAATAQLVSATADFTDADIGAYVLLDGFSCGTKILSITSSTEATLSTSARAAATGVSVLIGASVDLAQLAPAA